MYFSENFSKEKLLQISKNKQFHLQNKYFQNSVLCNFDCTLDIRKLYPNFQKYILEVGSGWGEFAIKKAKRETNSFIFCLEKKMNRIITAIQQQEKNEIENIKYMVVNIHWFFEELFVPNIFDEIIINFPDPWPKKKHHKHRYISTEFIDILFKISTSNALLEIVTDYYPYIKEILFSLTQSQKWGNQHAKGVLLSSILNRPKSCFHLKKEREGHPIYCLQFRKKL